MHRREEENVSKRAMSNS